MPEDSDDPSLVFLHEDIDTQPERHAFLGNYRRYSAQVIEYIVRQKQSEAIYHILSQVDQSMHHLYDGQPPFAGLLYHVKLCGILLNFTSCNSYMPSTCSSFTASLYALRSGCSTGLLMRICSRTFNMNVTFLSKAVVENATASWRILLRMIGSWLLVSFFT